MDRLYVLMEDKRLPANNAVALEYAPTEEKRLHAKIAVALGYVLTVAIIYIIRNISLYVHNAIMTQTQTPSKCVTPKSKNEQL